MKRRSCVRLSVRRSFLGNLTAVPSDYIIKTSRLTADILFQRKNKSWLSLLSIRYIITYRGQIPFFIYTDQPARFVLLVSLFPLVCQQLFSSFANFFFIEEMSDWQGKYNLHTEISTHKHYYWKIKDLNFFFFYPVFFYPVYVTYNYTCYLGVFRLILRIHSWYRKFTFLF